MGHPPRPVNGVNNPTGVKPIANRYHPSWHTINYHAVRHARFIAGTHQQSTAFDNWPGQLIDPIGQFVHSLPKGQSLRWQWQLHHLSLVKSRQARLHLLLGEDLVGVQQPEAARWQFRCVERLMPRTSPFFGRAAYDLAIAKYRSGQYPAAANAFSRLANNRGRLVGYDLLNAQLMFKHVSACAGYHAAHAKLGIPEPIALDPLCGAAAIAVCMRSMHLFYGKNYVAKRVPHTGEGSSLAGIVAGAKRLGLQATAFQLSSPQRLRELPLPCVAFVEHDHFIAVTHVTAKGVTYVCSDCGPWPGGPVSLTWSQWDAIDPSAMIAIVRPHTVAAARVKLLAAGYTSFGNMVASAAVAVLAGVRLQTGGGSGTTPITGSNRTIECGYTQATTHCTKQTMCPVSGGGGSTPPGCPQGVAPGQPVGPASGGGQVKPLSAGPTYYDPVNLATGEEEYGPEQDLKVYNPIGPDVEWTRIFDSLRGYDPAYQYDDFGQGWSQEYNRGVFDPTAVNDVMINQNTTTQLPLIGQDRPAGGATWDVVLNGTVVASSNSPAGWSVMTEPARPYAGVAVPASASPAEGYELRTTSSSGPYGGGGGATSLFFDVLPADSVAQASQLTLNANGTAQPSSGTWDVVYNGTVIANSNEFNSWFVSTANGGLTITTPGDAALGGGYEVRVQGGESVNFNVVASHLRPGTGQKYLFFPNGSRVRFTTSAIPTAANPVVNAVVENGNPYIVQWVYDANSPFGHYVITNGSRTKWITTGPVDESYRGSVCYVLSQQVDALGNAINFQYNGSGASGFPLLTAITDKNNLPLLTISRATDGTGNVTAVTDRYGRSVYYSESTYDNYYYNTPTTAPVSAQELNGVSQIVSTGTGNPPNKEVLNYILSSNNEGYEKVWYLHTITVPSPTGTGTATATINYASNGSVTSIVDANGNTKSFSAIDGSDSQVTVTNPQGAVVYTYAVGFDNNMSQTSETDGNGNVVWKSTFGDPNDPLRPSQTTDGNGIAAGGSKGVTTNTWDAYGNCTSSTNPYGTVSTYAYNYSNFALGELTSVTVGGKTPITLTYEEPSGLLTGLYEAMPGTAGSGQTVAYHFAYDALGNLVTEISPGNNATQTETKQFSYTSDPAYNYTQAEALHEPIAVTDNLGHVSHFRYDAQANKISEIDALGNETDMAYNIANQLATITFPAAGMTGTGRASLVNTYLYPGAEKTAETQYNEAGTAVWQQLFTFGPEGESLTRTGSTQPVSETYDAMYRVATVTDGDGNTTHYTYNTQGYPSTITYPGGDKVTFAAYDNNGNLLQRVDGRGVVTNYLYNDPESKLTDVQYPATPAINVHVVHDGYGRVTGITDGTGSQTITYDDLDNKVQDDTTYTNLPQETVSWNYNPDGSRASLGTPGGGTFSYSYDAGGRLTGLTNSTGQTWAWTYLNNDWLVTQQDNGLVAQNYVRNARGFITELTNKLTNPAQTVLADYRMGWDNVGNLGTIAATVPLVPNFSGTTSFAYDYKTELTAEQSTRVGGYQYANTYDGAGNITSFKGGAQTYNSDNQNSANGFDGDGNPTTYHGSALTWDAENRMTSFGTVLTAGYRGDGLRGWKQSAAGRTYYLYDGTVPVAELNASGAITAITTFGPGGPLARTTGGRTLLYTPDAQGNVSQQVNATTGAVVASYAYDAWGGRTVSTTDPTAASDPYAGYGGLHGYYTDWETGLQLCGLRYYDSAAGRWLNRDPISYAGGVNVYEYCGNGPVGMSDASGMLEIPWLPTIGWSTIGCLVSVGQNLLQGAALCDIGTSCACSLLSSILTAIIDAALGGIGALLNGCISGALASICSEIMGYLCHRCDNNAESPFCRIAGAIMGAVTGCIAGVIGGMVPNLEEDEQELLSNLWGAFYGGAYPSAVDAGCQFANS